MFYLRIIIKCSIWVWKPFFSNFWPKKTNFLNLQVLKCIDNLLLNFKTNSNNNNLVESIFKELIGLGLWKEILLKSSGADSNAADTKSKDVISHYFLTLCLSKNNSLRGWLKNLESQLFNYRYLNSTFVERQEFLESSNLHYKCIEMSEKRDLMQNLQSTFSESKISIESGDIFKVIYSRKLIVFLIYR